MYYDCNKIFRVIPQNCNVFVINAIFGMPAVYRSIWYWFANCKAWVNTATSKRLHWHQRTTLGYSDSFSQCPLMNTSSSIRGGGSSGISTVSNYSVGFIFGGLPRAWAPVLGAAGSQPSELHCPRSIPVE